MQPLVGNITAMPLFQTKKWFFKNLRNLKQLNLDELNIL